MADDKRTLLHPKRNLPRLLPAWGISRAELGAGSNLGVLERDELSLQPISSWLMMERSRLASHPLCTKSREEEQLGLELGAVHMENILEACGASPGSEAEGSQGS